MADFYSDLARGRQGEVLVANAFRNMGYEVTDVTKNESYQVKDIDLLIDDNGTERQMEVKADWGVARTGNVVLEIRKLKDGKAGWYTFTESTHLAFVDMHNRIAYIGRTQEVKDYVNGWILQAKNGMDVSAYIKPKDIHGYFCLLLNVENSKLFQKLAV